MKTKYYTSEIDTVIVQQYFPNQDKVTFISFWKESNARMDKGGFTVGMWKIKQLKSI